MEWARNEYVLSDERDRLDRPFLLALLRDTYWAANRTREAMDQAIDNSLCVGLYCPGQTPQQVGFARAVTDTAIFTWICDVVVAPAYRRRGLGKWMVECLINHPLIQTRSQVLATQDAHDLYARFGFRPAEFLKRSLHG